MQLSVYTNPHVGCCAGMWISKTLSSEAHILSVHGNGLLDDRPFLAALVALVPEVIPIPCEDWLSSYDLAHASRSFATHGATRGFSLPNEF